MVIFLTKPIQKFLLSFCVITSFVILGGSLSSHASFPLGKKVLVVMSYHQGYQGGEKEIKEVLDEQLESAEVKYIYLDTKRKLEEGPIKAKKAYEFFQQLAVLHLGPA